MTLYCISGLGADHRAFERLQFDETLNVVFLPWLEPETEETLRHYAQRMAEPIMTHEPFALLGLSFGGIISGEMSHFLNPEKIILLSTIAHAGQLPWYFKVAGKTQLHKSSLASNLKTNPLFIDSLFGQKNTPLSLYLKEKFALMSPYYLSWSLDRILTWTQSAKPTQATHIHGSADRVFPIEYTEPDIVVRGGSHYMVYTHAKQVSKIIQEILFPESAV